jgi:hypothetical protein
MAFMFPKQQQAPAPIIYIPVSETPTEQPVVEEPPAVKQAAVETTTAMKKKRGMASTISTSSEGLASDAPTLKRKMGE